MSARAKADREVNLRDVRTNFRELERREWWRWGIALLIIVVLTLGILSLSLGAGRPDIFEQERIRVFARGLLGMALIFDAFAIYQQILITRLRRDLAAQIGMMSALEVLKPPTKETSSVFKERRQGSRCYLDTLLRVKKTTADKKAILGRTRDLSGAGLGAVIPEYLNLGDTVVLEFSLEANAPKLVVSAVVRHRQGFHHGFELIGLGSAETEAIMRVCAVGVPFEPER